MELELEFEGWQGYRVHEDFLLALEYFYTVFQVDLIYIDQEFRGFTIHRDNMPFSVPIQMVLVD